MPEPSVHQQLRSLATRHRIALHQSRAEEQAARTFVIWAADGTGMAICPADQPPAETLQQLYEEIELRQDEARRSAAFQARAAGIAALVARTSERDR